MVVSVDYVELLLILVVSLMSIALVSVEINNQESLVSKVLLHVLCHKGDVRIDTESPTVATCSMMIAAR